MGWTRGRRTLFAAALAATASILLSSCLLGDVRYLAGDDLGGRDNGTAGSLLAQQHLLGYLRQWTDGAVDGETGDDAYRQTTTSGGTNLVGILPGSDLADEYSIQPSLIYLWIKQVLDQAELMGILNMMYDLGLPLLGVECFPYLEE